MKKIVIIVFIGIIIAAVLGISTGLFTVARFDRLNDITREILNTTYFNWYESQALNEIEDGNRFAKERLEKKYHVFVNNILVDIGYDWDGSIYVPIRTICESLNWSVNWIPELGVIKLIKDSDEANVDIVNFFGKAYVNLDRLENILRLQVVRVYGGNIEIYENDNNLKSINIKTLTRYHFYIDGMKMTDRAVEYKGDFHLPLQVLALSFGRTFRYDAVKGYVFVDNQPVDSIFVDGEAFSTLDEFKRVVDTGNCSFNFLKFTTDEGSMLPPVFKGSGEKIAALTFDDYLGDEVYPLLEVLKANNVKATFYVIGNSVKNNSAVVKALVEQGHEVANHTWDHLNLHTLRDDEIRAQLISTQLALREHGGKAVSFRPPGGYFDNKIVRIAQDIGLYTVLWSLNSTDADLKNGPDDIKKTIVKKIHPGAIIVMHMSRDSTIEALTNTIKALSKKGYRFVTFSEMMENRERK